MVFIFLENIFFKKNVFCENNFWWIFFRNFQKNILLSKFTDILEGWLWIKHYTDPSMEADTAPTRWSLRYLSEALNTARAGTLFPLAAWIVVRSFKS